MQDFLENHVNVSEMIEDVRDSLYEELKKEFNESFIFIIDEWECVFREYKEDKGKEQYLKFLRGLFKDQPYIDLVYMASILPIKKYGTHSALNMFREISMLDASPYQTNKPAIIVVLKYDQDVESGIKQIKAKKYFAGLEKYLDNLLLVSISYDKDSKKHECMIEKYQG